MVGLRDIPDWGIGLAVAGTAWFGVSYTFLAPRALEKEVSQEIVPECTLTLEAQQEIAVADALAKAKDAAAYANEQKARALRVRQNELRSTLNELFALEELNRMYDSSGLGALMEAFGTRPNIPVPDRRDIEDEINSISRQIAKLNIPDNITIPKTPRRDLVNACLCAATEAVAGKRSAYAVSLASFRTVEPEKLLNLKSDMAAILNTDICNAKPWENLS